MSLCFLLGHHLHRSGFAQRGLQQIFDISVAASDENMWADTSRVFRKRGRWYVRGAGEDCQPGHRQRRRQKELWIVWWYLFPLEWVCTLFSTDLWIIRAFVFLSNGILFLNQSLFALVRLLIAGCNRINLVSGKLIITSTLCTVSLWWDSDGADGVEW